MVVRVDVFTKIFQKTQAIIKFQGPRSCIFCYLMISHGWDFSTMHSRRKRNGLKFTARAWPIRFSFLSFCFFIADIDIDYFEEYHST